jgi:capsid protein
MIDPAKDTAALVSQVRAGFVPLPEAVASFGYDFRQAAEMVKEANAALDDAGVSLDTDPRRVARSGAAQDAAQMAAVEIAATGAAMPQQPDQMASSG